MQSILTINDGSVRQTSGHTWANDDRVSGSSLGGLLGELNSCSSGSAWQ